MVEVEDKEDQGKHVLYVRDLIEKSNPLHFQGFDTYRIFKNVHTYINRLEVVEKTYEYK
jgi:hypothetical protein